MVRCGFFETKREDESTRMLSALWFLWLVSKKPHHATLSKKARNHSLVSKKGLAVVSLKPSEKPRRWVTLKESNFENFVTGFRERVCFFGL